MMEYHLFPSHVLALLCVSSLCIPLTTPWFHLQIHTEGPQGPSRGTGTVSTFDCKLAAVLFLKFDAPFAVVRLFQFRRVRPSVLRAEPPAASLGAAQQRNILALAMLELLAIYLFVELRSGGKNDDVYFCVVVCGAVDLCRGGGYH